MGKSTLLFAILLTALLMPSCDLIMDDEQENGETQITETDAQGAFAGEIDVQDWSAEAYEQVYFGDGFWLYPSTQLMFLFDSANQIVSDQVRIYNSREENLLFDFTGLRLPFSAQPAQLNVSSSSLEILTLQFQTPDPAAYEYKDTLAVTLPDGESLGIPLHAVNKQYIKEVVLPPDKFLFLPAYPNPSSESITFRFTVPITANIRLYVTQPDGRLLKTLINKKMNAGRYAFNWDYKEDETVSSGYYTAVLEAPQIIIRGDIQINK